ncbi:aryl-alcohol dehydrogenase-like predicted oxidoreductase [Kribbella voronezhensis]|uniref:Aryl-alcohol dehydrogenase-like predicted oxidoreductase n=1 Tax=Kribbella voronezhensis TaxID=2512212 RepID=A0A4R7T6A2_9ACTN|nr:aldo/keto reductase [Kribbella voronezhensis]TDU86608.1 aryl-alcohol dehydrogenase-like predicted oxidoreductase [Kribbella voronezhensis]
MTKTTTTERRLGRDGRTTSALGVGCWAIGGQWESSGRPAGWGEVDDEVSVRMIHTAVDAGIRLLDTADVYGTGHSELVVGRALKQLPASVRAEVTVATKFGNLFDEATRKASGQDVTPAAIRRACEGSLRRLGVEALDLYQLHGGADTPAEVEDVVATLEKLVAEGKVKDFGTSVDAPAVIAAFGKSTAVSVQSQLNVFGHNPEVLGTAHEHGLAVLARTPLAMGLLTGKYNLSNRPSENDVRRDTPWWTYFDDDAMADWLGRLEAVREILTTDGRTLTQGALAYLWALDPAIIPLPGARTPEQVAEHAAAIGFGPLADADRQQIDELLADSPERH